MKPTQEQWNETMKSIKDNNGKPHQLKFQEFGNYFLNYFIDSLPPIYFGTNHVMCSEPYSTNEDDEYTYIAFFKKKEIWYGIITTPKIFKDYLNNLIEIKNV